jgi:hypothetical protein
MCLRMTVFGGYVEAYRVALRMLENRVCSQCMEFQSRRSKASESHEDIGSIVYEDEEP